MRVVVASAGTPFDAAGPRSTAERLAAALRDAGHQAEALFFPLDPDPERVTAQMLVARLTDIRHDGELMVSIGWPTHLLEHPGKVVWFGVAAADGSVPAAVVPAMDGALAGARRVLSGSASSQRHLLRTHGIETELVGAPPEPGEAWRGVVDRLLA